MAPEPLERVTTAPETEQDIVEMALEAFDQVLQRVPQTKPGAKPQAKMETVLEKPKLTVVEKLAELAVLETVHY